jgi:hypothetical protein
VKKLGEIPSEHNPSVDVIEPTLFRTEPTPNLVNDLGQAMRQYGGKVHVILNSEYYKYQARAISILAKAGIHVFWIDEGDDFKLIE